MHDLYWGMGRAGTRERSLILAPLFNTSEVVFLSLCILVLNLLKSVIASLVSRRCFLSRSLREFSNERLVARVKAGTRAGE